MDRGMVEPRQPKPKRPEERSLNTFVLVQTYVLKAMTGLGYLALTWSTVVLLGGFVTTLGKYDFWSLTVISMLQAARVLDDLADQQFPYFAKRVVFLCCKSIESTLSHIVAVMMAVRRDFATATLYDLLSMVLKAIFFWSCQMLAYLVLITVLQITVFLYILGPLACLAISSWRITRRDYGVVADGSDNSKTNLLPALDLFYYLVIIQGALYLAQVCTEAMGPWLVVSLRRECEFPEEWGAVSIQKYLTETKARCWEKPASIDCRRLIHYSADLLDSTSWEDNLTGVRMLDCFVRQGADISSLLLPFRPRIEKLFDMLGWRRGSKEIRKTAARIVAELAGDIHLAGYPGAISCISSLVVQKKTTRTYWEHGHGQRPQTKPPIEKQDMDITLKLAEKFYPNKEERRQQTSSSSGDGELARLLHGLTILERLALDLDNCRDISTAPGLLSNITAPVSSITMIDDIRVSESWANVVNGTLKVLHRLICVPGNMGTELRCKISCNNQTLNNLEMILRSDKADQELQMRAVEILTELALDSSANDARETRKNLINKLLQIFLKEETAAAMLNLTPLKATAGKALALLSTNCETNLTILDVERLAKMLDANTNIIYMTIAAHILENLCARGTLDQEHVMETFLKKHVKETLLPKILTEILNDKGDTEGTSMVPLMGDEEDRFPQPASHSNSANQGNHNQSFVKKVQEALLSLTLVIYEKMIIADDFANVVRAKAPGQGAFVQRLKNIVEENCQATPISLSIVKLCGQIALSMMQKNLYTAHFKDLKFVESLSKASDIMSNIESSMLFNGTDYRAEKTSRPLLFVLVQEVQKLVP